jgi:hypothetical protein
MANRAAGLRPRDRVLVWGWRQNRPLGGLPGTVVHIWISGIGERVYTVILDAPDEIDGTCVLDVAAHDLVRAPRTRKAK